MSEILDKIFPLDQCEEDILGGYEDLSDGLATNYFKYLTPEDREIVHWYAGQGHNPLSIEYYAKELAESYAVVDPNRTSRGGISSAHAEVARIRRFIELYINSENFFPLQQTVNVLIFDENGINTGDINIDGWTCAWSTQGAKEDFKYYARDSFQFFDDVDRFLDHPLGAPLEFNQSEIIASHKNAMKLGQVE